MLSNGTRESIKLCMDYIKQMQCKGFVVFQTCTEYKWLLIIYRYEIYARGLSLALHSDFSDQQS
jgi:hypothetical protein